MTTMHAAYITRLGTPDEIRVGPLPAPEPAPDEVLVRVEALAVNQVDVLVRSGAYRTPIPMPFIIGRDLVGVVAIARPGFDVGERVWCNSMGHAGRQGAFAEQVAVPAERLYRLPDDVDPVDAVAVLHAGGTAHLGLFREGGLRAGQTVMIGGGAGGVGLAAVQLARAAGARVIATASARDAGLVLDAGAREVLDYRDPRLHELLRAAAPEGIDLFWDTSGHHDLEATLPLLARGGKVIIAAGRGAMPPLPVWQLYTNDLSIRGFVISNASVADLSDAATTINTGLADGVLRPRIGARFALDDAAEAHRLQESPDKPAGRIVVVP